MVYRTSPPEAPDRARPAPGGGLLLEELAAGVLAKLVDRPNAADQPDPATWASTATARWGGKLSLALEHALQIVPFDEPHRQVELAVVFARLVDRDHVRMVERCRQARLAQEASPEVPVLGQLRRDQLQGHRPLQRPVPRGVDHTQSASADQRLHPISGEARAGPHSQPERLAGTVMTRSTTDPWKNSKTPAPGGVLPVTRKIGIWAGVMSPWRSSSKSPRRPSFTSLVRSSLSTEARVPSERAMASSTTSVACAAVRTPKTGVSRVPKSRAKRRPAGLPSRSAGGTSVVLRYKPCAPGPACSSRYGTGPRFSMPIITTRGPRRARRVFSTRSPPPSRKPAMKTHRAPEPDRLRERVVALRLGI